MISVVGTCEGVMYNCLLKAMSVATGIHTNDLLAGVGHDGQARCFDGDYYAEGRVGIHIQEFVYMLAREHGIYLCLFEANPSTSQYIGGDVYVVNLKKPGQGCMIGDGSDYDAVADDNMSVFKQRIKGADGILIGMLNGAMGPVGHAIGVREGVLYNDGKQFMFSDCEKHGFEPVEFWEVIE